MSMKFTKKICPNCNNQHLVVSLVGDFSKACIYRCLDCNEYFSYTDFEKEMEEREDQSDVVRHARFVAWQRIKNLANGIKEQCESPSSNIEIVEEWVKEIQMQCEILKKFDLRKT